MRIGIDISQIVYEGTGVARFTKGLVNSILEYDKDNKWLFFFSSLRRILDKDTENKILAKGHRLVKWKIPPTILSLLWNDLHVISKSYMLQVTSFKDLDCFITSDWTEPSLPCKKAAIVHDLVFLRYPETVDKKILKTHAKRLKWVKKDSKIIFADSQATKKDLMNLLNIDSQRIFVNYPGVDVIKPSRLEIAQTLNKYKITKPFILTVGKIEPRKNYSRLIQTFNKINNNSIDLVVVGPYGWNSNEYDSINRLIEAGRQNIKCLGSISDEELFSLFASSLFYIQPSIWEGFGYPVVEAMKLAVPVATSNTSSLKEIASDAALLFNPLDVQKMYQRINTLIRNKDLRVRLSKKGLERSKMFTWKNYYDKFISVLKNNLL